MAVRLNTTEQLSRRLRNLNEFPESAKARGVIASGFFIVRGEFYRYPVRSPGEHKMNAIDIYCMANQDRSDRVRWLLEELQVPYTDHYLSKKKGDMNTLEYRSLNPMGRVPTINDNGTILFESGAICLYLADRFTDPKLAPDINDPERAEYLQWMVWSVGSLECVIARMFTHLRNEEEIKVTHHFVKEQCEILKLALIPVLTRQEYILKSGFSAADIMLAAVLPGAWDYIVEPHPSIKAYMERLMARPAAIRAKVFETGAHPE